MSIKDTIRNILDEATSIVSNDLLVSINNTSVLHFDIQALKSILQFDLNSDISSILQTSESTHRDTGILPICAAIGIMEWNYKEKKIKSPLFLLPLSFQKNKIKKQVQFSYFEEDFFLNPFLKNYFKNSLDLIVPDFEFSENVCSEFNNWIQKIGFNGSITEICSIGNFHHHRYQIIKDLEGLVNSDDLSNNVLQILGNEDHKKSLELQLSNDNLFPVDNDQLAVFTTIQSENCVIQGPPGTGKSQVLATILGKTLLSNNNTLVVSEKRVALDVLQKKLAHFKLDDFSFLTSSETVSKDFIISLKTTWDRLEQMSVKNVINLRLSEQYIQQLQQLLNLLSQKDLIGGVSFDEFHSITKAYNFTNSAYFSDCPTLPDWLKDVDRIKTIYDAKLFEIIPYIPFEAVRNDTFEKLDIRIDEWNRKYGEMILHFEIDTMEDIQKAMKVAAICQVIENEDNKAYISLLNPDSKERKKYNQLKKKLAVVQLSIQKFDQEKQNWKDEPSENEAKNLIEALSSTSYFKKRKAKKRISELTKSAFIDPEIALINWIEYLRLKNDLLQLKHEFREIGVQTLETDFQNIEILLHRLDKNDWQIYIDLSVDKRKRACDFHSDLNQFNSILKTYFQLSPTDSINHLFSLVGKHFEHLIRHRSLILSLEKASYRLLGKTDSFEKYTCAVFKSNWVKFEGKFPALTQFKPNDLYNKVQRIITQQEVESKLLVEQIENRIVTQFQSYQHLLRTASTKLSVDQKLKKQRLKKGKAILVKEFSKTRSHPSIRELLQTEAVEWIHLLKPIWFSNPTQLAKCFPLEKELFDLVIFDEATQIPLSNALGALHRGKRIIVAGDEHQMSPTSYFTSGSSERMDLLHQASYYWKNNYLKHHYRSQHPDLIEFSNKHFYQNSLIAYPSGNAIQNPIHFHYCEKGKFIERKNEEEAKMVVQLIETYLKNSTVDPAIFFNFPNSLPVPIIFKEAPTLFAAFIAKSIRL